jgi:hypothetical protein
MKKILAFVLSAMMLLSAFAMTASAEDVIYETWEDLAINEDYPYYNAYPNGKTPTIDGVIAADEYLVKIELDNDDIIRNNGGAKDGSIPEFVNIYVHVDAEHVYFGLEIQNDKAANAYYKDADEKIAEGWMDWRFTFVATSETKIAPVYNEGKYYNMTLRPRLDADKTNSALVGKEGKKMSWGGFNWGTGEFDAAWVDGDYSFVTTGSDVNKHFTSYEMKFTKAGLLAVNKYHTGTKMTYLHVGMWINTIWAEPNAEGVMASVANSRVGWGYVVDADLSMKTDLVLPVGQANYDCDKAIICVAITDEKVDLEPATTTTAAGGNATTTAAPTTTTKAPATTTKAPATTTAAGTTAAATTTAATTAAEKGCGSALVVSAAALIPALGFAFVASKKRED